MFHFVAAFNIILCRQKGIKKEDNNDNDNVEEFLTQGNVKKIEIYRNGEDNNDIKINIIIIYLYYYHHL